MIESKTSAVPFIRCLNFSLWDYYPILVTVRPMFRFIVRDRVVFEHLTYFGALETCSFTHLRLGLRVSLCLELLSKH